MKTKLKPLIPFPKVDLHDVQDHLMTKVVELTSIEAISSTTIRVSWEILADSSYVEGFFVRFRDMSGGSQKFNMKTVMLAETEAKEEDSVTITSLRKFTEYEVFLMPFYERLEGQPSNSLHVQTLEDAPSAPPGGVRLSRVLNASAAELIWSPPPPQHRNGVLKGYQLHIRQGNGTVGSGQQQVPSVMHSNVTLNATTTRLMLANLSLGEDYTVRACAFTNAGLGPFSAPVRFRMDPSLVRRPVLNADSRLAAASVVSEPWFVALLGSVVFGIVLTFAGVIVYRRQWASKHAKALGGHLAASAVPVGLHDARQMHQQDHQVWLGGGWKGGSNYEKNGYAEGQDLYAEVGDCGGGNGEGLLTTFNGFNGRNGCSDPAPYATTTLAMQNSVRTLVSGFSSLLLCESHKS